MPNLALQLSANAISMKKLPYIALLMLSLSCASSSFQRFFNDHKTDMGTTSFQVPNFMRVLMSAMSPEAKKVVDNISDFKYIQFSDITEMRRQTLISEMNAVTNRPYKDMFRKNEVDNIQLISVRESGATVTDVIIFYSNKKNTQAFYLKGLFDPNQLKTFSDRDQFSSFTDELIKAYQNQLGPSIKN